MMNLRMIGVEDGDFSGKIADVFCNESQAAGA